MIYFNAQGITSKLAQLKTLISDENTDIICISETWCNKDILDSELVVPNYVVFRRDRNIDHFIPGTFTATARGGVMILLKQHLQPTVSTINDHKTESLWLIIKVNNGDLLLGVCYRPEVAGINYIENLCKCFSDIPKNCDVIITGDFNFRDIDWEANTALSASSKLFLDCVKDNFFTSTG